MHHQLLFVLVLLFVVLLLVMAANRFKIAYPIFLVIAGLGISFIPGVPRVTIDPELIFTIFLPPLLYEAAWNTAWKEFWKWKRAITLLGFGLVFFTSLIVAYFSHLLIPGCTIALGFLLGGIISPPDAVAATTVLKGIKVPKRIVTILEGESLINDAASLIVFKFSLAVILTGTFSMQQATSQFFIVSCMGIIVGLAGAHLMYAIHRFMPTTAPIDAALSFMTPYMLYLAAEQFHFSGVMAVVSGGLFLSFRSHETFNSGHTRINMLSVWNSVIFVLNALVFILIGLELPEVVAGLGDYSIADALKYSLIISGILIAVRFLWVYPATHLPRLIPKIAQREASPGWKGPFLTSWAGMRGVVSLSAALSIPLYIDGGTTPFPHRNLIIFITFVVIFITLVFQGLTLPLIIKWIKLDEIDHIKPEAEQKANIQLILNNIALKTLNDRFNKEAEENNLLKILKTELINNVNSGRKFLISVELQESRQIEVAAYNEVLMQIFKAQRYELFLLKKENQFDSSEIRKAEVLLDLNEMKVTGLDE